MRSRATTRHKVAASGKPTEERKGKKEDSGVCKWVISILDKAFDAVSLIDKPHILIDKPMNYDLDKRTVKQMES
ncbi:hypothetical protein llap_6301 [Limosa lapponica baueri]|uniref:Uncharacterized protein n=1 Tax=Limosa lapponica baueri TaxID=1758121 RepID=A0A2I0UBI9_LIMLA|nr:hypothetical protein llap_6301 [Limosa lapponica baueri]